MAIPQQVKKQEEAAQKKWDATYSKSDEDASANEETPAEQEEELALESEESEETEELEQEPESPAPQEEDWQHKFSVLEGKYRAEVPRLHEENRSLRDELSLLRNELEALKDSAKTAAPAHTESDFMDQYFPDLDSQGREQFMGMVRKAAAEAVKPISDDLGVEKEATKKALTQSFWMRVKQAVPDYESLTTNADLLGWLNERMPGTNVKRMDLMDQSFQTLDSDRYIEFIELWKQANQSPQKQDANPALKQKVTPPRAGGAGKAKPDKKTYTQAEYKARMAEATRANIDRRYQAATKIINELDAAQREGRITP